MVMNRINWVILSLLLCSLVIVGCGRKKVKDEMTLNIEWSIASSKDSAYLYTYGAHDVRIDTLVSNSRGRVKIKERFDRDTLDLFVLRGPSGELLLPLIPRGMERIKAIQKKDTLLLEGMKCMDQIREYHRLLSDCGLDISESMMEFIEEQRSEVVTLLMVQDLMHRFPDNSCGEQLRRYENTGLRVSAEIAQVLGIQGSFMGDTLRLLFPEFVNFSGEKDQVKLKQRLGKKYWMAVSLLDIYSADSSEISKMKRYFNALDSLGIPSYHVLPSVDSLPKSWSTKKGDVWRAYLLDSLGMASNFMEAYQMMNLPSYLLVDSTMTIWRTWEESDSLIQFVKQYNTVKKEAKKATEEKKDGDRVSK